MSARRVFLIGAEQYGEGFAHLPAVREDVAMMREVLTRCGFETRKCDDDVVQDASRLDRAVRAFCRESGPGDVNIIYFSGHGMRADGVDWIIPAGTSRADAQESVNQRVSTDLTKTIAARGHECGLIIFIIDACRDQLDNPVAKGAASAQWGEATRLDNPDEHRFVRLFGCTSDQVCQVLPASPGQRQASLFTKALVDCLEKGSSSLNQLLESSQRRCKELAAAARLKPQRPRMSYGEATAETTKVLEQSLFNPTTGPVGLGIWDSFEPNKLHCLVVTSEFGEEDASAAPLSELVKEALTGNTGKEIWKWFRTCCDGRRLISEKRRNIADHYCERHRKIAESFRQSLVSFGSIFVTSAVAADEAFEQAVRAVVEADLVIFDVTRFEPAVMLLVGIRAAATRGVSICSHADNWREGEPLQIPFNLQDLNINSHTRPAGSVGADPVLARLALRIKQGFSQLSTQPRYLDLPAYDAVRQLGARYEASSTIGLSERVLVLCSYSAQYVERNWGAVRKALKQALGELETTVERIIDYGTPQLVSQSMYEHIRRSAACVVDWTEYKASVFLELGVRLAVSEWGAIQIVDDGGVTTGTRKQLVGLRQLFSPVSYRPESADSLAKAVEELIERKPGKDGKAAYNRVHYVVVNTLESIQEAYPAVFNELSTAADALHHPRQGQDGAPQIVFYRNRTAKYDSELAALERRIAAWLYLEHRCGAGTLDASHPLKKLHTELAQAAVDALYGFQDDEAIAFAEYIEGRLREVTP